MTYRILIQTPDLPADATMKLEVTIKPGSAPEIHMTLCPVDFDATTGFPTVIVQAGDESPARPQCPHCWGVGSHNPGCERPGSQDTQSNQERNVQCL